MIVVSDSSPIMNLATIQQLALLERLYGRITVPPAGFWIAPNLYARVLQAAGE